MDSDEKNLDNTFFKELLTCIEGHAEKIDKFRSDRKSRYCNDERKGNIKFHNETTEDPDWFVK